MSQDMGSRSRLLFEPGPGVGVGPGPFLPHLLSVKATKQPKPASPRSLEFVSPEAFVLLVH